MSDTKHPLDLSALERDYAVVGELGVRGAAQQFSAMRKGDGGKRGGDDGQVLITVVTAPAGDEGNALSHLAADTKLLADTSHRRLIPVIEGRWVGEAFAVVTQRTTDSSLAERLVTGERFSNTRAAAILREVNGVIEWACAQGVVHRAVTPDGIFLEPKTDRVRVAFSVAPLSRLVHPGGASEDARTIARLAVAMLTGKADTKDVDAAAMHQLRPDLPMRFAEATAAILGAGNAEAALEIADYIALIGMAEPLAAGEVEVARLRDEVLAQQTAEREKLAGERAEFERTVAAQRAEFEEKMTHERGTFDQKMKEEHEKFEALMVKERAAHAEERAKLQQMAKAERAQLVAKREELERFVAEQVAETRRVAAKDRQQLERLRAEVKAAGELEVENKRHAALHEIGDEESEVDAERLQAPSFAPFVPTPLQRLEFDDDTPLMRDEPKPNVPSAAEMVATTLGLNSSRLNSSQTKRRVPRRAVVGAGVTMALVLAALIGIRFVKTPVAKPVAKAASASEPALAPTGPAPVAPLPARPIVTDSSGGNVAQLVDSTRAVARDSARAVVRAASPARSAARDSALNAARPAAETKSEAPQSTGVDARNAVPVNTTPRESISAPVPVPGRDPGKVIQDPAGRHDTISLDSVFYIPPSPVKRDTPTKRDTTRRPDTTIAPR